MKLYDTWERYFNPKHPKHIYQRARFNWFMDRICGEKFLDVGCAGGLGLFLAAEKDFIKELHGVDKNPESIKEAKLRLRKYVDKKFVLRAGKAEKLEKENGYFDCVMCGETLEHLNNDKMAMAELSRVTNPGGIILISVPDRGHTSIQHVRLYNKLSLRKLITDSGCKVIEEDTMKSANTRYYYLLAKAIKL